MGWQRGKKKEAKQNTCPCPICYYLNPLIPKFGSGFEETKSPQEAYIMKKIAYSRILFNQ